MNEDDFQLDPYHKDQDQFEQSQAQFNKEVEEEKLHNQEIEKQAELEQKNQPWSYNIPVVGQVKQVVDQAALGVGDFAFDAIGLVPWLKPADQWWDKETSGLSQKPWQKLIRDASSVILPSMVGGGLVVGGVRSAVAARTAMTIPKYAHILGTVGAYTGVDTTVAMISSLSLIHI